jgi:hypothetical protein
MPRKTYGPEQIIGMLREADVALGQGRRPLVAAPLPRTLPRAGIPRLRAVSVATEAQRPE